MTTILPPKFDIPSPSDLGPDPEPCVSRLLLLMELERQSQRRAVVLPLPAESRRSGVAHRDAA